MSDDKQRYLIVPDTTLQDIAAAPTTRAAYGRDNDEQSQGIEAKQPVLATQVPGFYLRASGNIDSNIERFAGTNLTDSKDTAHVTLDGRIIRSGIPDDARFVWAPYPPTYVDPDDTSSNSGWQFRQSPLVAHRAVHTLTQSSIPEFEDRPWRVQPKMIVLGDGTVQCYSISSARPPASIALHTSNNQNFGVPGYWQHEDNRVWLSTLSGYPRRVWDKAALPLSLQYPLQAFTAACIPGTSDVLHIAVSTTSVAVYVQPADGIRERRASFGFVPWDSTAPESSFRFVNSVVYSCDCAFLPTGRLVLVVAHEVAVDSFVSDDLGLTWHRSTVLDVYDTDKDDYYSIPDLYRTVNDDYLPVVEVVRDIRVPKSGIPVIGVGSEVVVPGADGTRTYTKTVASNEHCAISLCVADNGNLVLGLVYPTYRNLRTTMTVDSIGIIQPVTTNTAYSTIAVATSLYCSTDGLTWGGGTIYTYDSPAIGPVQDYERDPFAIVAYPYYADFGTGIPYIGRGPEYHAVSSATWPISRLTSHAYDDPDSNAVPYSGSDGMTFRSEVGALPTNIAVVLGPEGYVDVYLTTNAAWMGPYAIYGETDYRDRTSLVSDSFNRVSAGKLLLQHRRFATKQPSPAENPDIWIPVTGNTLPRFHTLQVRSVRPSNEGPTLWGASGYAGGVAAVSWRGETLLTTNAFSRTVTDPFNDAGLETATNSVGQVVLEMAGWQPLTEVLGWASANRDYTHPYYSVSTSLMSPTPFVGSPAIRDGAAQGRIYGTVWDCANFPGDMGWTEVRSDGGAKQLSVSDSAERGYLALTVLSPVVSGHSYYTLADLLPNSNGVDKDTDDPFSAGLQSISRFCVRLVEGTFSIYGTGNSCFYTLRLRGGGIGAQSIQYFLFMAIDSGDVQFSIYDNIAGAFVSVSNPGLLSGAQNKWLEFVITTQKATLASQATLQLFVRVQDEYDPDFEAPFAKVTAALDCKTLASSEDLTTYDDYAAFGLLNINQPVAAVDWNYIAIHRPTTASATAERAGVVDLRSEPAYQLNDTPGTVLLDEHDILFGRLYSFDLETEANNSTTASLLYNNSGVLSAMLGGQLSTTPVWTTRGMELSAFGGATPRNSFRWETGPSYDWRNFLLHPVMKEWRSQENRIPFTYNLDEIGTTITLEVPTDRDFRPEALALLGRNSPNISVYFEGPGQDALLKLVSPALEVPSWTPPGTPIFTDTVSGHYWGHASSDTGPSIQFRRNRVSFWNGTDSGATPYNIFRPHQFYQADKGPIWYYAFQRVPTGGGLVQRPKVMVYRIRDNGANWLALEVNIEQDLDDTYQMPTDFGPTVHRSAVYSDRAALDISELVQTSAYSALEVETITVRFHPASFRDPGHNFHRLGRLVLGDLIDLSEPDCEWAWSMQQSSGNSLYKSAAGPSFATANSPSARQFACAYPLTKPADLPDDVYGLSPNQSTGTWRHKVDILGRLQMDGQESVLIWQGEQFNHAPVSATAGGYPTVSDPMDIMMVRAGSTVTLQQQQYQGYSLTQRNSNVKCVPLPYVAVGGIVFNEEF